MVIASFGAMQFLPDLVKAIDNDWLRFDDSPPDHADVVRRRPLHRHAHARPRRRRRAVPRRPPPRCAAKARRRGRRGPSRAGVRRIRSRRWRPLRPRIGDRRHKSKTSPAWAPFQAAMRFASFEPALSQLMSALTPIVIESARDRISRGELSFDDLLVLTRRLLQTSRDVRARGPRPASVPVRRRVPGHRPGAVRRHHRAHVRRSSPVPRRRCSRSVIRSSRSTDSATPTSSCSPACWRPTRPAGQLTVNRRTRADVCAWINAVLAQRFAQIDDSGARPSIRSPTRRSSRNATPTRRPMAPVSSCWACPDGRRSTTTRPKTRPAPRPPTSPRWCNRRRHRQRSVDASATARPIGRRAIATSRC